jgi:hypothetical protein
MPIPVPTGEDEKSIDMGECIRFLRKEGYTDSKQRIAICMSQWRKAHGKKQPKGK